MSNLIRILHQIKTVAEDNKAVSRPDLALKFIALLAEKALSPSQSTETETGLAPVGPDTEQLRAAINKGWREIIQFPFSQVCKHWAIMTICSQLEKVGEPFDKDFVTAIVNADDATSITYKDYRGKDVETLARAIDPQAWADDRPPFIKHELAAWFARRQDSIQSAKQILESSDGDSPTDGKGITVPQENS